MQALSHDVIILGDFNCNMLTCNPLSDKVKDMCSLFKMKQIIDKTTRVTNHSCTCMDDNG